MDQEYIKKLESRILKLEKRLDARDRQQLKMPLDVTSQNVLADTLKNMQLESINVRDIFFLTGRTVNPVVSGQLNYYDGGSKGFRIYVNGFTGQIDATGI